ncbi:MAG: hypothetical protein ACLRXC_08125 [[Clostridium] leptum]
MLTDVADSLPDNVAVALFNGLQVIRRPDGQHGVLRDQLSAAPMSAPCGRTRTRSRCTLRPSLPRSRGAGGKPKNPRTKHAVLIVVAVFVVLLLFAGACC